MRALATGGLSLHASELGSPGHISPRGMGGQTSLGGGSVCLFLLQQAAAAAPAKLAGGFLPIDGAPALQLPAHLERASVSSPPSVQRLRYLSFPRHKQPLQAGNGPPGCAELHHEEIYVAPRASCPVICASPQGRPHTAARPSGYTASVGISVSSALTTT